MAHILLDLDVRIASASLTAQGERRVVLQTPVGYPQRASAGVVRLVLRHTAQRTVLHECYSQVPLQVMRPLYLDDVGTAYVYMLSPGGGVVGGDTYHITVVAEAGARVCLTTPAATRLYATLGAPASQRFDVTLHAGAVLEYMPDQTIPFAQAAFVQHMQVRLGAGACVIVRDLLAPGRLARGEAFAYHAYDTSLGITEASGQVLLYDHLRLRPGEQALDGVGMFEGYHYLGTLYALREGNPVAAAVFEQVQALLAAQAGLLGGVTQLAHGGLAVRLLGHDHASVQQALQGIWDLVRRALLGYPAVVWRT